MNATQTASVRIGMRVRMIEAGRHHGKLGTIEHLTGTHVGVMLDDERFRESFTSYPLRGALKHFEVLA